MGLGRILLKELKLHSTHHRGGPNFPRRVLKGSQSSVLGPCLVYVQVYRLRCVFGQAVSLSELTIRIALSNEIFRPAAASMWSHKSLGSCSLVSGDRPSSSASNISLLDFRSSAPQHIRLYHGSACCRPMK